MLREAIVAAGPESLSLVLEPLQSVGSWRLQLDFQGWLANLYSAEDVIAWVGTDSNRARLVASLTDLPDGPPSDVVGFLLTQFGDDDQVTAALYGNYIAGSWWGNESARINGQIEHLDGWIRDRNQPAGVKAWARKVIADLARRRTAVLEEEAEEDLGNGD
jgi:hypothetical protein